MTAPSWEASLTGIMRGIIRFALRRPQQAKHCHRPPDGDLRLLPERSPARVGRPTSVDCRLALCCAPHGIYPTIDGHLGISMANLRTLGEALSAPEVATFDEADSYKKRQEISARVAKVVATNLQQSGLQFSISTTSGMPRLTTMRMSLKTPRCDTISALSPCWLRPVLQSRWLLILSDITARPHRYIFRRSLWPPRQPSQKVKRKR